MIPDPKYTIICTFFTQREQEESLFTQMEGFAYVRAGAVISRLHQGIKMVRAFKSLPDSPI